MSSSTTTPTAVEPGVGTVFAEMEAAWNAADGARFGAPFAPDADFVDVRGVHHRGRAAIAAGHDAILAGPYAGSVVAYRVVSTRSVGDAVVTHVEATLDAPTGPLAGVHDATISALAVRSADGWALAAFHNTLRTGG
jgi:uncharacterized protein (TIGR02246 family)